MSNTLSPRRSNVPAVATIEGALQKSITEKTLAQLTVRDRILIKTLNVKLESTLPEHAGKSFVLKMFSGDVLFVEDEETHVSSRESASTLKVSPANFEEKAFAGYTKRELVEAFDLVRDRENWKNPIKCSLSTKYTALLPVIESAIVYYTGSTPSFEESEDKIVVTAPGYYLTIGA